MADFPLLIYLMVFLITLPEIAAVFAIGSSAVIALSAATGVVWYIWKGKTLEQCKEDLGRAEKDREEYRKKTAEAEKAQAKAEALQARAEADKARAEAETKAVEVELAREQRTVRRLEREAEERESIMLRISAENKALHELLEKREK